VYGLAKQSAGHVAIESAPMSGTTVRLYFPRSEEHEVVPAAAQRIDRRAAVRSRTVLVVEDDADVRSVVTSMVTNSGHKVISANDGAEAMRVLAQRPDIDLLFSDVVMPRGVMGLQLAEHAKAHHPDLKVLLTTGHDLAGIVADSEDMRHEVELLRKPYGEADLHSAFRRMFDGGEFVDQVDQPDLAG